MTTGTKELKEQLAEQAVQILRRNFGEYMAGLYRDMYLKLDPSSILTSVRELLTEAFGNENAKKQLEELEETRKLIPY